MKNWYILQTRANYEHKVAERIKEEMRHGGLGEALEEVLVPTERVLSTGRGGKKIEVERRVYPSYILLNADVEDPSIKSVLRSIPGVVGFLGAGNKPVPLSASELEDIRHKMKEGVVAKREAVGYKVGDHVKVVDGAFDTFSAVVEEVDEENEKVGVSVAILGRQTKVKLGYGQVGENVGKKIWLIKKKVCCRYRQK